VASWFLRRSGSRVSILIACRRTVPVALSLCVNPMPSRITRKSTRPRVADRTMVDTVTTTSACQFQKPIGVVATHEHAAVEMEQSKTRNHRARHKTRASLVSHKGLDAANHNRVSGGGRRMFLTSPLIEPGDYTHPMREDVKRKHFSTPLGETSIGACIQAPSSSWRGFWFNAWSATEYDRDTDRSCWFPLSGFMQRSRHHSLRSCASQPLA
jgi:hypothetical protein